MEDKLQKSRKRYPCEPTGAEETRLDKHIAMIRRKMAQGFWRPVHPTRKHYQEDKG